MPKINGVYFKKDKIWPEYTPYRGFKVTDNTLFFITNDWNFNDYSPYRHKMNSYWTATYTTLSNWNKVYYWDWTRYIYSDFQKDANNNTAFTMHIWFKWKSAITSAETTIWWRMMRNWNGSDRWWAKFQSLYNQWYYSRYGIIYWPNYSDWVRNDSLWIDFSTSAFKLFTVTINWSSVSMYENWAAKSSWTWSYPIQWWTSLGTSFYYWWWWGYYDWLTTPTNILSWYRWDIILEKRVWSASEIQTYYNNSKSLFWL